MKVRSQGRTTASRRGFTLMELLVTIVIVAALAAIVIGISGKLQESAKASTRLANMRQAGTVLLGVAADRNGRCQYFSGGNGNFEYRHYLMVRNEIGRVGKGIVEIMHWDTQKRHPGTTNQHWNCRAINFKNVNYPDGTSTRWVMESVKDGSGTSGNLKTLSIASVVRPNSYPLLIDSARPNGGEIFRIDEAGGDLVGLREGGGTKASAFFFDGSARYLGKAELKESGFTKAIDTSKSPPVLVNL